MNRVSHISILRKIDRLIREATELKDSDTESHTVSAFEAIENKDIRLLQRAIKHGANVNQENDEGVSLIEFAVIKRDMRAVETLIKNGAETVEAFERFIGEDDVESIKVLIDCGANPNEVAQEGQKNAALHTAVLGNKIKIVQLIANNGGDVMQQNAKGLTPIDIAKKKKFKDCYMFLKDKSSNTIER